MLRVHVMCLPRAECWTQESQELKNDRLSSACGYRRPRSFPRGAIFIVSSFQVTCRTASSIGNKQISPQNLGTTTDARSKVCYPTPCQDHVCCLTSVRATCSSHQGSHERFGLPQTIPSWLERQEDMGHLRCPRHPIGAGDLRGQKNSPRGRA